MFYDNYQSVKLDYQGRFFCPYCRKELLPEEGWDEKKNVCKHLLYIQTYSYIDFLSKKIRHILEREKGLNLDIIENLEFEDDEPYFVISNIIEYPSLVEYELYSEAPGGQSLLIGISHVSS